MPTIAELACLKRRALLPPQQIKTPLGGGDRFLAVPRHQRSAASRRLIRCVWVGAFLRSRRAGPLAFCGASKHGEMLSRRAAIA